MKQKMLYGLVITLILNSRFLMGCYNELEKHNLIFLQEAQQAALSGIRNHNLMKEANYSNALKNTIIGETILLVQRLDKRDNYYYLIPFNKGEKTSVIVIVDAKSGEFLEASIKGKPEKYPRITEERAKEILFDKLKKSKLRGKIISSFLVWEPCEESQSLYEPLWMFIVNNKKLFVGQDGKIYERLTKPVILGGSTQE